MADHLPRMHERFLRHIWSRQYLDQTALCTTDGRAVRVLSAGRINEGCGPDFVGAKIRIGGTTFAGDVEIHRDVGDWITHHHQNDPRYNRVILHVVLEAREPPPPTMTKCGRAIPTLVLEHFLTDLPETIWSRTVLDERSFRQRSIRCRERNGSCSAELLQRVLLQCAEERFAVKVRRFRERLHQLARERTMMLREPWRSYMRRVRIGNPQEIPPPLPDLREGHLRARGMWDQILYEGFLEGLGYSRNRDPFLRLARSVTLDHAALVLRSGGEEALEAVLLGAGGLLPKIRSVEERDARLRVRRLRALWTSQKNVLRIEEIHPADWVFSPARPMNFPTARAAAAVQIVRKILHEDLFRRLVRVLASEQQPVHTVKSLRELMVLRAAGFWSDHLDLQHPIRRRTTLVGRARTDDLICNTVLPVGYLYADIFREQKVQRGVKGAFEVYPSLAQNGIIRLLEQQLFRGKVAVDRMVLQQGALHLYRHYCLEERCAECEVGMKVFQEDGTQKELPATADLAAER